METQEVLLNGHAPPLLIKLIKTNDLDAIPSSIPLFSDAVKEKPALPVKMTCFVPSQDVKTALRDALNAHSERSAFPVTIVVQPPLGTHGIQVLLWYLTETPAKRVYHNNCMAVELENGHQWLFIAQDLYAGEMAFETSARHALTSLFTNLDYFGFNFHDLLHTWFFIPRITGFSHGEERYQIFNRQRRELFLKQSDPDLPVAFYPASTGIGCLNTEAWASAVAFKSGDAASAHMMDNERQVPAYHYPKQESIEAPLFARGMCLRTDESAVMFVSGTASILNSKTVHENDIVGQTHQTIKNILGLITQNAAKHMPAVPGDVRKSIRYATVYIKQEKDYPAVKDICCSYFGDIPMSYVKADICRDNLLVEIECIACMNVN